MKQTARNLAKTGRTNMEIAKILNVYPQLVDRWVKSQDPEYMRKEAERLRNRRHEQAKICPVCHKNKIVNPGSTRCTECYRTRRKEAVAVH